MATNHTPNYGLCQWEPTDKVLHTDFNEDNVKIEAAIKAVDERVDVLSGTGSALDKKGNCTIYRTMYAGTGAKSRTITFPHRPYVVFIAGDGYTMSLIWAMSQYNLTYGSGSFINTVSWGGNSVTWSCNYGAIYMLNEADRTYHVVALLRADE